MPIKFQSNWHNLEKAQISINIFLPQQKQKCQKTKKFWWIFTKAVVDTSEKFG